MIATGSSKGMITDYIADLFRIYQESLVDILYVSALLCTIRPRTHHFAINERGNMLMQSNPGCRNSPDGSYRVRRYFKAVWWCIPS